MAYLKNFQHDVFISYAHDDNNTGKCWVTEFKKQLQAAIIQHLGSKELAISSDDQIRANHALDKFVVAAGHSALFLAIASPCYVGSDWTKKEYQAFVENNATDECLFTIELLPITNESLSGYPKIARQYRMPFYQTSARDDLKRPLQPTADAFDEKIHELAEHICQQLKTLAEQPTKSPSAFANLPTYIPNCRYDVLISHTVADEAWASKLCAYLKKQLQSRLETHDGFQIATTTDDGLTATAATLLVIASPVYYQQHSVQSEPLSNLAKQNALFLVEYEPCKHSGCLNGPTRHKFWVDDDTLGITPITDDAYYFTADKLAATLAEQLKKAKGQQEYQQRLLKEQARQQSDMGLALNSTVFLCGAPEDYDLVQTVKLQLRANKIGHVPIEHSSAITPVLSKNRLSLS